MKTYYRDPNLPLLILHPKDFERLKIAEMRDIKYRPYGQHPLEKLAKKICLGSPTGRGNGFRRRPA